MLSTVKEKHSVPILCSPVRAALAPRTFKVHQCSTSPLDRVEGASSTIWTILAQSLDTLISHIDSLLIHLESLRLCVNIQRAISPPPLARSHGDESPPLARSRGDESLPLVRSRGDEIPPFARSSRGQLSSLRLFRQGSSVQLKVFQRLLGLKVADSAVLHLGLLHMRPLQLWLKSRVPWTAWTSGCLRIAATSKL